MLYNIDTIQNEQQYDIISINTSEHNIPSPIMISDITYNHSNNNSGINQNDEVIYGNSTANENIMLNQPRRIGSGIGMNLVISKPPGLESFLNRTSPVDLNVADNTYSSSGNGGNVNETLSFDMTVTSSMNLNENELNGNLNPSVMTDVFTSQPEIKNICADVLAEHYAQESQNLARQHEN